MATIANSEVHALTFAQRLAYLLGLPLALLEGRTDAAVTDLLVTEPYAREHARQLMKQEGTSDQGPQPSRARLA